jgi:carboxyl-terminal processing protease
VALIMIRRALASLVLCLVLLFAGIYLGGHPSGLPDFLRNPLVGDEDTRVVTEAIDRVNQTYYREIPKKDLANKAIAGVVASLDDRFSNYFSPVEYKKFTLQQSGEFAGIGVQVTKDADGLKIVEVYDGSPAKKAKIAVGDIVTAVAGTSLKGKTSDQSVALIQGEIGTPVKLTVRPVGGGKARAVTLTRSTISVPSVTAQQKTVKDDKYGVIALSQFSSGVHGELSAALKKAIKDGDKGVVLDMRGNPGGLVDEAQLVASQFLSDGKIVTTKGRDVPTRTLSAVGDPVAPKLPLVVLVDRNSASAAEIVSGALQDRKRATLVGTRTFGKGVFQEVLELSNGGALDITAGQYFLPSGRNLGGAGVSTGSGLTPDVQASDDPKTTKKDEALDKALDVLAAKAA